MNGTGILQWDGSAQREIQISFLVKVKKWTHDDAGRGSVGFIWNANNMTSSDSQDPPRNWAAILRPGRVVVFSQPARPEPKTDIAHDMPMNRFVPVKAKITKSGIQMQVGRQTVVAEFPCENLVHLQLVANYGHFEFYKLKVRGK